MTDRRELEPDLYVYLHGVVMGNLPIGQERRTAVVSPSDNPVVDVDADRSRAISDERSQFVVAVEIGVDKDWLFAEITCQTTLLPDSLTDIGHALADVGVGGGGGMPARFVDAVAQWIPTAIRNIGL